MIFIVLVVLAVSVVIAIGLIMYFSSRNKASGLKSLPGTEVRLLELDALRAKNLISETEYEEKKKRIIDGI